MERQTAVVKWFNNDKGFGFLINSEGTDVFVHHENLMMDGYRYLVEDQEVEFTPVITSKGISAAEVVPADLPQRMIVFPADPVIAAAVLCDKFSGDELDLIIQRIGG